jgi:hypothetical protein
MIFIAPYGVHFFLFSLHCINDSRVLEISLSVLIKKFSAPQTVKAA